MAKEQITIAGGTFDVPNPYAAGHTLTDGEADALNQVLHENIRNNLAKKAKDGTLTQAEVDDYAAKYEFGVRVGGGGRAANPVQSRAMDIARDKVKAGLRKAGKNVGDYSAKQITSAAVNALEKHPEWLELARQQIKDEQAVAAESLDDIVSEMGEPNKPEEPAEAA